LWWSCLAASLNCITRYRSGRVALPEDKKLAILDNLRLLAESGLATAQHLMGTFLFCFDCESDAARAECLDAARLIRKAECLASLRGRPVRARRDVPPLPPLRRLHALRPQLYRAGF
jgi:hypothetical protein